VDQVAVQLVLQKIVVQLQVMELLIQVVAVVAVVQAHLNLVAMAAQVLLLFATLVHNVVRAVRLLPLVVTLTIHLQHQAHLQLK
jgi:hypothetical protein